MKSKSARSPSRKIPGGYKAWALVILFLAILAGDLVYRNRLSVATRRLPVTHAGAPRRPAESAVAIVQSTNSSAMNLSDSDIEGLVREAVRLSGGLEGIVHNGDTVVLKPNLVLMRENDKPDSPLLPAEANGITTDWRVTKAVVKLVRELNPRGKVYIMENSAIDPTKKVMVSLKYTPENISEADAFIAIEDDIGGWRNTNSAGLVRVDLPDGLYRKTYYLNRTLAEADVLISLPVLKNHFNAVISGSLKNVGIGSTPASIYAASVSNNLKIDMVNHLSDDLHKWIRDYILCRKIDFVVMDGLQGLQNGPAHSVGPLSNDQMNMRLILAGRDAVAVDTVEALVMGWDPESINHLVYLDSAGAGNSDIRRIAVAGRQPDEVRKVFQGQIPLAGGRKVFDFDPPDFTVKNAVLTNGELVIETVPSPDTHRMDVFLDSRLLKPAVTNGFNRFTCPAPDSDNSPHVVRVRAFDRYFNRAEANFDLNH